MRDRNLLHLFLGLNVALAVAFAAYLFLSSNSQPKVVATNFGPVSKTNQAQRSAFTNFAKAIPAKTNAVDPARAGVAGTVTTNVPPPRPVFTQKKFDWRDVEATDYPKYINSLRA